MRANLASARMAEGARVVQDESTPERPPRTTTALAAEDEQPFRRTEEELRRSEERLRFALEGANDGLWDVDLLTGDTYLSPRGREILGYGPGEPLDLSGGWSALIHPDDLPTTVQRLTEHLEGRAPVFQVEQRLRTRTGEWRWVLARGKVVARDESGRPARMSGTHTDISARIALEERIRHAGKMEAIGRLAGGVAHDFGNWLLVMDSGIATALEHVEAGHPARLPLEEAVRASGGARVLLRQLLTLSRRQDVAPAVMDLGALVAGLRGMLARVLGPGVALVVEPGQDLWPVRADASEVESSLLNLVANARQAIPERGTVTVSTGNVVLAPEERARHGVSGSEFVALAVRDDGVGMGPEVKGHLFEPFFTSKPAGQGTGLGLAMVHGTVARAGGFVTVASEPGRGSTFTLFFPRLSSGAPGP